MSEWHGIRIGDGAYGWKAIGVAAAMSERHPETEHPLRGPEEPPAAPPPDAPSEDDEHEPEKKEE